MRLHFTSSTLLPSGPGWRLTYFGENRDPVASFWAPTREAAMSHAATAIPLA